MKTRGISVICCVLLFSGMACTSPGDSDKNGLTLTEVRRADVSIRCEINYRPPEILEYKNQLIVQGEQGVLHLFSADLKKIRDWDIPGWWQKENDFWSPNIGSVSLLRDTRLFYTTNSQMFIFDIKNLAKPVLIQRIRMSEINGVFERGKDLVLVNPWRIEVWSPAGDGFEMTLDRNLELGGPSHSTSQTVCDGDWASVWKSSSFEDQKIYLTRIHLTTLEATHYTFSGHLWYKPQFLNGIYSYSDGSRTFHFFSINDQGKIRTHFYGDPGEISRFQKSLIDSVLWADELYDFSTEIPRRYAFEGDFRDYTQVGKRFFKFEKIRQQDHGATGLLVEYGWQ